MISVLLNTLFVCALLFAGSAIGSALGAPSWTTILFWVPGFYVFACLSDRKRPGLKPFLGIVVVIVVAIAILTKILFWARDRGIDSDSWQGGVVWVAGALVIAKLLEHFVIRSRQPR